MLPMQPSFSLRIADAELDPDPLDPAAILAGEQQPEVSVAAKRPEVDRGHPQQAAQTGRLGGHAGHRRRGRQPLRLALAGGVGMQVLVGHGPRG